MAPTETAPSKALARRKRTSPTQRGIDWDMIAREWIEGIPSDKDDERTFMTLREAATYYDVSYDYMREKAAKGRWRDRRESAQLEQAEIRRRKRALELGEKSVEFDSDAHKAAKLGITLITSRLAEIAQEFTQKQQKRDQAFARLAEGLPVEREELWSAIRPRELEMLAGALQRFHQTGQQALGTNIQRTEVSGPNGESLPGVVVSVSQELNRDDSDRLASILTAMQEAGLINNDIIDAEIVEEDDAQAITAEEAVGE